VIWLIFSSVEGRSVQRVTALRLLFRFHAMGLPAL
jgi:hypothetical protein